MSIVDKATGRVKKAVADLTDDEKLRPEGRQEEGRGESTPERGRVPAKAEQEAQVDADLERPSGARRKA